MSNADYERVKARWIRVEIESSGRSTAHGCTVKLTVLNDSEERHPGRDATRLRWSSTPKEQWFRPLPLPPKDRQFVDVVYVKQSDEVATIPTEINDGGFATAFLPGRYLIRITAFSDDAAPTERDFRIAFDGTPNGLSMSSK
jgi:hypothetical protein